MQQIHVIFFKMDMINSCLETWESNLNLVLSGAEILVVTLQCLWKKSNGIGLR